MAFVAVMADCTIAVVAICVVFVVEAAVGAAGVPVNVGLASGAPPRFAKEVVALETSDKLFAGSKPVPLAAVKPCNCMRLPFAS